MHRLLLWQREHPFQSRRAEDSPGRAGESFAQIPTDQDLNPGC
jgi:hypothetical protein